MVFYRSIGPLLLLLLPTLTAGFAPSIQTSHSPFTLYGSRNKNNGNNNDEYIPSYLATCIPGCASILADELAAVGCRDVFLSGKSAVTFSADTATALQALLHTRTAHKMMELLCESHNPITNRNDLYQFIKETVNVKDLLLPDKGDRLLTIAVDTIMNLKHNIPSDINHSHYTALTVKNAIADACVDLRDDRPDVDLDDPDVPLVCSVLGTEDERGAVVSLYRQLHPTGTLHKRGYRYGSAIHKAAMKESMAAALLLHSGWQDQCRQARKPGAPPITLLDPMTGSGSLLLEGACIAGNVAPGLMRIKTGLPGHRMPPVTRWKSDPGQRVPTSEMWKDALVEATDQARQGLQWMKQSGQVEIIGNDIHTGALDLFESALNNAGLADVVQLMEGDCLHWKPATKASGPWTIVSNPPWDVRLSGDMHEAWEAMRVFLRETCPPGTEAWVLSGNPAATKHLGLRKTQMLPLQTGQQDLRWIQYMIRDRNAPPDEGQAEKQEFRSNNNTEDRYRDQAPPRRENDSYRDQGRDNRRGEDDPQRKGQNRRTRSPQKKRSRSKVINDADNAWLIN